MTSRGHASHARQRMTWPAFHDPQIEMAHGAGGLATRRLIEGLLVPAFGNSGLQPLGDAAIVDLAGARIAMTADSFVVRPLRFPGGSIGELAVNGTVNDLAVAGAVPKALLVTFVLEAGLERSILEAEVQAIADAARRAGVVVVGGDTKVVEHGKADGMYVTTAGIGLADRRANLSAARVCPGDSVLLSGYIGDHGSTVLLARGQVELELARETGLAIRLDEARVPVRDEVRGICELLGLDPLHIANEGQFLAVVGPEQADAALAALRSVPGGDAADIVGEVQSEPAETVSVSSAYGAARIIQMLVGDPLPRIC